MLWAQSQTAQTVTSTCMVPPPTQKAADSERQTHVISAQQLLAKTDSNEAKWSIKWPCQKKLFGFDNIQLSHFFHPQDTHLRGMLKLNTSPQVG